MNRHTNQFLTSDNVAKCDRRRGYTLVEMLIVISLSSLVLATIGVTFYGIRSAQRAIEDRQMAMDSISRLAEQFRADVHAAKTAEIAKADGDALPASAESSEEKSEPERQMLRLVQPDQKEVQYRFDGNRIARLVRSGDQITQRETFALPEHCQVLWQLNDFVDAGASARRATVLLNYPLENQHPELSERRQLRIDAIIGLHTQEVELNARRT